MATHPSIDESFASYHSKWWFRKFVDPEEVDQNIDILLQLECRYMIVGVYPTRNARGRMMLKGYIRFKSCISPSELPNSTSCFWDYSTTYDLWFKEHLTPNTRFYESGQPKNKVPLERWNRNERPDYMKEYKVYGRCNDTCCAHLNCISYNGPFSPKNIGSSSVVIKDEPVD